MSAPLPVRAERPPVSLSMSGMCRMKIWLAGHGAAQEPVSPKVQRVFDLGHKVEQSLFDGTTDDDGNVRPPWWDTFEEVEDPATGEGLNPPEWEVGSRQDVVEVDGFTGHIDAIIKHRTKDEFRLPDAKSARDFSFKKLRQAVLTTELFARQYVIQVQLYMKGKILAGDKLGIRKGLLFFINKDDGSAMFRAVPYDEALVDEGRERLSWARSGAEPEPEWKWEKGQPLPTMCSYCQFKAPCAEVRGVAISFAVEKAKPVWRQV